MPRPFPRVRRPAPSIAIAIAFALAGAVVAPAARGQGCPCGTAADELRAAEAGLVREWIVQVPFDSAAWRLDHVAVGDGLVVAQAGDGSLHAIRSAASATTGQRAGTVAWSRSIADAAGDAWPPTIGPSLVVVASELAVHALDRETGIVEWERPTGSLTAASAVQSGTWVYAPLRTSRVLRLPANPLGQPASEPPPSPEGPTAGRRGAKPAEAPMPPEPLDPIEIESGGALNAAPSPLGNGVVWSTSNGLVALERTPLGWVRHEFPESRPPSWVPQAPMVLAGPPVVRGAAIHIATTDGSLARIDLNDPKRPGLRAAWAVRLPDLPSAGPLVGGDVVVVALGPAGVAAFSAADGRELWRSPLVGTLVAAAGGRAWLLDTVGRLTALDLATGSRRQSLCPGCFRLPVVNTLTERLVLASPGGLVVSLAPPASPTPAPAVNAADAPAAAPAPADPDATPP
ncbi:MAG: PQQ-binding-like beta-propeller repeat protein [Planctomycetaceae bacterium]